MVYDLDRTLTRRGTYLPFLVHAAVRLHPWRLAGLPVVAGAMLAYRLGRLSRERLKELMQAVLLGRRTTAASVRRVADSYADRLVPGGCRSEVVARLRAEQAEGCAVLIATAAQRYYAEAIAARLGVDRLVATESVWSDGDLLARLDGPNRRGPAKRDAVAAWLAAHPGLAAHGFRFYSDETADLPTFELAAERVVVHPGRSLRRVAAARGWEVVG